MRIENVQCTMHNEIKVKKSSGCSSEDVYFMKIVTIQTNLSLRNRCAHRLWQSVILLGSPYVRDGHKNFPEQARESCGMEIEVKEPS